MSKMVEGAVDPVRTLIVDGIVGAARVYMVEGQWVGRGLTWWWRSK